MSTRVKRVAGANYTSINIGKLSKLGQHEFVHPKTKEVDKGRIFLGELLNSTGSELSFRELQPKTTIPFLHKHKQHEEIYIFLKGNGKFQVDDDVMNISEGSVIRVSPIGNRTLSNLSEDLMIYIVVQSTVDTLSAYTVLDGKREEGEIKL